MRAYPRYRESGIEWLSEVPEHWEVKRLKLVASTNDETLSETEDPLRPIVYVDIGSVDSAIGITEMEEMVFEDAPSRARRLVQDGDTIVSTVRTYLRAIASVSAPRPEMVVSTGFAVIRPRALDPGFASWALREQGIVEEIVARSTGVSYPAINASEIGDLRLPLPPLDEQRAIAAYLDRETERLDALVAKKRLLIERLEEYRTALITRTVTRGLPPEAARAAGLDPSPGLKPSGVEWLGDVPVHWEVKPLRNVAALRGGATPGKLREEFWDGDIPWVSPKDMKRASIADSEDHVTDAALRASSIALLPTGSVLVVVRGMILAHSFPVAIAATPVTINQDMKALSTADSLSHAFLYWYLVGSGPVIVSLCDESAHGTRKLETASLAALAMAIPPDREQRAIVGFLNDETATIDDLSGQIETAIQRLREYRSALVTAAVTGRVDVRE